MKKNIFIILFTIAITFLTTLLLEINFIIKNPVRYSLVIILIIVEIYFGIRGFYKNNTQI
jgi:hypothetical protein